MKFYTHDGRNGKVEEYAEKERSEQCTMGEKEFFRTQSQSLWMEQSPLIPMPHFE